jgi:hypothetical protein
MTQAAYNSDAEDAFGELIKKYYEGLDAEIAYNELFGTNLGDPAEIESYLPSIAEATKDLDVPISTVAQARVLLDESNFKASETTFKKMGVTTLIDPEILATNRVNTPSWSRLFSIFADRSVDLFYNTEVVGDTFLETEHDVTGIPGSYGTLVTGIYNPYPFQGFVAGPILTFLTNIGELRSRDGDPSRGAPYFQLVNICLDILSTAIEAQPDGINNVKSQAQQGLQETRELVAVKMDPNNPDSKVPVDDNGLWASNVDGTILTGLTYTQITPVSFSGLGDTDANGRTYTAPERDAVKAIEAFFLANETTIDGLIEQLASARTARYAAFLSEENRPNRVKERKQRFIDYLSGQTPSDSAGEQQAPNIEVALKSEKVKEAVLKADRNIKPFDLQCHLMQNITKLASQRQTDRRFQPRYRHINRVTTNGKPAEVLNTIQHGGQTGPIKEFINICPDVYGLLEPYIEIYRQEFEDDGRIKMKDGKPVEKRLHVDNFLDPSQIQTTGRTPGAGIKSFSWSLKGVQPAEVDNNITAKLVMYFQTINDFFNGASQAGKDEPNFLDLIINSPAVREWRNNAKAEGSPEKPTKNCQLVKNHLHEQYKGVNYRIRVNAGWAVPPPLMPSVEISQNMRDAIRQTQVSLYLQQVRHNLDFKPNGSLELTIDYVASIAGLLTSKSADIFAPVSSPQVEEELQRLDQQLEVIKTKERDATLTDSERARKKDLLEQKRQARQEDKLIKYRKLLCGLFQEQNSRIYNLTVNALDLLRPPMRDLDEQRRASRAKRFQKEPVTVYLADEINFTLLNSVDATLTGRGLTQEEAEKQASTKQASRIFNEIEEIKFQEIKKDPGSFRFIPFFYLGDLIDSVIQQIKNNNQGTFLNFRMFLSETEMIDPNVALQIGDLEDVIRCGESKDLDWLVRLIESDPQSYADIAGLSTIMNIGDIPISLDAFQVWFKDNVIKKNRESYFFLHFIKDICSDLVTKAMGARCFGTNINFQQRFDAQPLTLEYQTKLMTTNRAISSTELGKMSKKVGPLLDSAKAISGFILVSTDSKPSNLKGDYDEDVSRGIYHHFIGASCGLLKHMSFNREDQEYLREAKIQKFGALGAEQLRELYSARLDLVGNNLYKNGMYIYINPTLIGATQDELDYLGLHGYYLVTGVESKISPSGFSTSLTALHEGIRFDRSLLPNITVLDVTAEAPPPPSVNPNPKKKAAREVVRVVDEASLAAANRDAIGGTGGALITEADLEKAARLKTNEDTANSLAAQSGAGALARPD